MLHIRPNRWIQFPGTVVRVSSDLFLGERGKPARHQIDPGCTAGSEVQVKARPRGKPTVDQRRLVNSVVVQD